MRDGAALAFPRTYLDAVDGARSALRLARELGHTRLQIQLPVLPPDTDVEDELRPGEGANAWPGGPAQSHRLGVQPMATPLLRGYEPAFVGMLDVGMGVWSLARGEATCVSNVADLSFEQFAALCDGAYGDAPTRPGHTLLLLNPRLTSSARIGQPWQRGLRRRAAVLVDETPWVWAYRCRPLAAAGGVRTDGVVVASEVGSLRGSSVFSMRDGACVAASAHADAFCTAGGACVPARAALREYTLDRGNTRQT
jgi:hypothetical protein